MYTLFCFFATICVYMCIPHFLEEEPPGLVDMIRAETAGSYDVRVVKSGRAEDLIQWLQENRFRFDDSDTQVIEDYLRRGWCFTAAKITLVKPDTGSRDFVSEGLVSPLILRFPTKAPVLPLALTSTVGRETQILLYIRSQTKMKTDGGLKLHFAGEPGPYPLVLLMGNTDPPSFFSGADLDLPFLSKFKGTLTSDQMKTDLTLEKAADNQPYREHEFRW